MPNRVLVTGANGFAASKLCRDQVERGHQVRALVRRSSNLRSLQQLDLEVVYGDLASGDVPPNAFKGIDVVYHLAAAYRKESAGARGFFDVNVRGTQTVLTAAAKAGAGRFVHCSTVGVHGNIAAPPADETAPFDPGDAYQASKLAGEHAALASFEQYGLPGVIVRPVGIYGPGDMRFLKLFRAIDRGWFCMLGRGEVLYHLTYVDDLVQGFVLAGTRPEAVGETFILCGQESTSLKRLVGLVAQALGRREPRWQLPVEPFMLAARLCQYAFSHAHLEPPLYPRRLDFFTKDRAFNNTKAKRLLGFQPIVDLPTGIRRTADWYRESHLL